ncbi:MAG TPA: twin-arginine translocase TatA/TatE family subunit [Solirubrobacteraceae bacterium]|nr:twin-arginine translocase TatA/TatE family subunit [Solirubrobacteraceae bacterium]
MDIGWPELVIILVILLLVFGPKRLPGIGRSLGNGLRELRSSLAGKGHDDDDDDGARKPAELSAGPPPSA